MKEKKEISEEIDKIMKDLDGETDILEQLKSLKEMEGRGLGRKSVCPKCGKLFLSDGRSIVPELCSNCNTIKIGR